MGKRHVKTHLYLDVMECYVLVFASLNKDTAFGVRSVANVRARRVSYRNLFCYYFFFFLVFALSTNKTQTQSMGIRQNETKLHKVYFLGPHICIVLQCNVIGCQSDFLDFCIAQLH